MGITQAQLSRIETGSPLVHLDRLVQWARVLQIPAERLWFAMPRDATESHEAERRCALASAAPTTANGAPDQPRSELNNVTTREAVEWFAWQLWTRQSQGVHGSRVPMPVARRLDAHPQIIRGQEGMYSFTDPGLVDVLVAQRVLGDIAVGDGRLLSAAQTSHATDLTIGALTADNECAQRALLAWMRDGATAVLRVNAAGVLAKVGTPDLGDAAIAAIRGDPDARHLYLVAVASRVLSTPWEASWHLAATAFGPSEGMAPGLADGPDPWAAERLAAELTNPRDAAARWCSAVFLSSLASPVPDVVRTALLRAVRSEPCRENLRAYAAVLADAGTILT
jgi:transcriptional regulator with XRE-family HTH domain